MKLRLLFIILKLKHIFYDTGYILDVLICSEMIPICYLEKLEWCMM